MNGNDDNNSKFVVSTHNYPLFSTTSTGSSDKICVTFGRVSSAFSTGNVFDRKSNVRFRMSSLIGRNQYRIENHEDFMLHQRRQRRPNFWSRAVSTYTEEKIIGVVMRFSIIKPTQRDNVFFRSLAAPKTTTHIRSKQEECLVIRVEPNNYGYCIENINSIDSSLCMNGWMIVQMR